MDNQFDDESYSLLMHFRLPVEAIKMECFFLCVNLSRSKRSNPYNQPMSRHSFQGMQDCNIQTSLCTEQQLLVISFLVGGKNGGE